MNKHGSCSECEIIDVVNGAAARVNNGLHSSEKVGGQCNCRRLLMKNQQEEYSVLWTSSPLPFSSSALPSFVVCAVGFELDKHNNPTLQSVIIIIIVVGNKRLYCLVYFAAFVFLSHQWKNINPFL